MRWSPRDVRRLVLLLITGLGPIQSQSPFHSVVTTTWREWGRDHPKTTVMGLAVKSTTMCRLAAADPALRRRRRRAPQVREGGQGLGFSLVEVAGLLRLEDGAHCDEARIRAEQKLQDVRAKLRLTFRCARGTWCAGRRTDGPPI